MVVAETTYHFGVQCEEAVVGERTGREEEVGGMGRVARMDREGGEDG
jgi:hypothetical protein